MRSRDWLASDAQLLAYLNARSKLASFSMTSSLSFSLFRVRSGASIGVSTYELGSPSRNAMEPGPPLTTSWTWPRAPSRLPPLCSSSARSHSRRRASRRARSAWRRRRRNQSRTPRGPRRLFSRWRVQTQAAVSETGSDRFGHNVRAILQVPQLRKETGTYTS